MAKDLRLQRTGYADFYVTRGGGQRHSNFCLCAYTIIEGKIFFTAGRLSQISLAEG